MFGHAAVVIGLFLVGFSLVKQGYGEPSPNAPIFLIHDSDTPSFTLAIRDVYL